MRLKETPPAAPVLRSALRAWVVAGTLSGLPSTSWSLLRRQDVLGPARAAGTVLPGRWAKRSLSAGLVAHSVISAGWVSVLVVIARRRRLDLTSSVAAGLAIAALDLGVARICYPDIAALDQMPQWLDHVAFAALAGLCLRDLQLSDR